MDVHPADVVLLTRAIQANGVNEAATAGAPFTKAVATFANLDPARPASSYTVIIVWGDGMTSAGTISGYGVTLTVSGTHTYADPGADTIRVSVSDNLGIATAGTATSTASVIALGQHATIGSLPVLPGVAWRGFERGAVTADVSVLDGLAALSGHPEIDAVVSLSLDTDRLRPDAVSRRATDHLSGVSTLTVRGRSPLPPWVVDGVTSSPTVQLRSLRLNAASATDETADRLATAAGLGRLARLELPFGRLTGTGLARLLHTDRLPGLRDLRAPGNRFTAGFGECAGAAALGRLTALDLSLADGFQSADDVRTLFANLRTLRLAGNGLDDELAAALVDSLGATPLNELDLGANRIGDRGAKAIARSRCVRGVNRIDLRGNRIGADGFRELLRGRVIRPDVWVNLTHNPVRAAPPAYWWRYPTLFL